MITADVWENSAAVVVRSMVIARVNVPEKTDAFDDLAGAVNDMAIDNLVERPALLKWTVELGRSDTVEDALELFSSPE